MKPPLYRTYNLNWELFDVVICLRYLPLNLHLNFKVYQNKLCNDEQDFKENLYIIFKYNEFLSSE